MIRPLLSLLILLLPLSFAAETPGAPEEGTLESAYRTWTKSLVDDGTWEIVMPPENESKDLEALESTLLEHPNGTQLEPGLRAGYLVALADGCALAGDRAKARSLYRNLGESQVPLLQMWSAYMLAGFDFAEGRYAAAKAGYERVCGEGGPIEWQDHACSMAGLAGRLESLELEGGDHGDPVDGTP